MNKQDWAGLKVLYHFTKKHWRKFLHVFFWIAMVALLRLPMPLFSKFVIDEGLMKKNLSLIHMLALGYIGFLIINYFANILKNYASILLKERITYDLKLRLYQHLQTLSHAFYRKRSTGYLMSRIGNDVSKVENLLSDNMLGILLDLITLVAGLSLMFFFHWKLTLLCLILLPFYLVSLFVFGEKIKQGSREVQESVAQASHNLQEGLSGFSVIKSFLKEKYEALRFSGFQRKAIKARIRLLVRMTFSTTTTTTIGSLAPVIVLWYGGSQVLQGNLTIGEMIAFGGFVSYVFGPTQKLVMLNFLIKDSMAAFERILELLQMKPEIASAPGSREIADVRGEVSYRDVSYSYDGEQFVLHNVSAELMPGEIVALVGRSGAGKSTFLNLLPRFADPQSGEISIDGIDVRDFTLPSLRRQIGMVLQETFLFSGTIAENISYGKSRATLEEIEKAARQANVHDFVMAFPDGYTTRIGERGAGISGGEKQRIAIARVILKGSRILILDEATSQLDSESEHLIERTLSMIKKDKTIIVIAHRLSTILSADRILVLEKGRLVGDGTHQQLYAANPDYQTIFDQQFKGELVRPGAEEPTRTVTP